MAAPIRYGRFMRVSPSPWLVARAAESTTVATKPLSIQLLQFIFDSCHLTLMLLVHRALRTMSKLLLTLHSLVERQCRANQPNVCEGLRKIAQGVTRLGVDLFTVKSNVVLVFEQRLHQLSAFVAFAPAKCEILGLPETTDRKSSFGWIHMISVQQSVARAELPTNRLIGGLHP